MPADDPQSTRKAQHNSQPHPARRSISAADERTPLLATSDAYPVAGTEEESQLLEAVVSNEGHQSKPTTAHATTAGTNGEADGDDDDDRPLPKLQIFLLCYARLVEPIAFFSIFPFVNQMIEETGGLAKEDVGFYSGLIV